MTKAFSDSFSVTGHTGDVFKGIGVASECMRQSARQSPGY